jgi:hypothetical protein
MRLGQLVAKLQQQVELRAELLVRHLNARVGAHLEALLEDVAIHRQLHAIGTGRHHRT